MSKSVILTIRADSVMKRTGIDDDLEDNSIFTVTRRITILSADFTAIIGFKKQRCDIKAFYKDLVAGSCFQSLYNCIDELKKLNPQSDWGNSWTVEKNDGYIEISGMGGISFLFSEHCCMIQHYLQWISFVLDDVGMNYQSRLRDMCSEVANYFDSTFAIYFPDSTSKVH